MERGALLPVKNASSRTAAARARRAEMQAAGTTFGRPKGVLNKSTIAKIQSKEAFDEAIRVNAGRLADDLLRNSQNGDTAATKVALEQTFGKPKDSSLVDGVKAAFSLLALATRAAQLERAPVDVTKDIVNAAPDMFGLDA